MKPTANSASARPLRRSRPIAQSFVLMVVTMIAGLAIRFVPLRLPAPTVKYGGSMLWALMIYWIVSALSPSLRLLVVALISAALATAVEFFKLHRSPALDAFIVAAPSRMIDLPTAAEPVKEILATSGFRTSSAPTTSPLPETTLQSPFGSFASCMHSSHTLVCKALTH
jgi:Protein of unknown function (DUF2809)